MKFFIDTADIAEIREANALGLLDGVTTDAGLVARTGRRFRDVLDDILAEVDGPICAELAATDHAGMIKEAKRLANLHENIVVKIPLTLDGLKATRWCTDNGIATNVTLCFSPVQALLAAKVGAHYISPFVGHLDDVGADGMGLVEQIIESYNTYDFDTEVLVAGVRSPMHIVEAARMGADVAAMPFSVLQRLASHPLTEAGLAQIAAGWDAVPK